MRMGRRPVGGGSGRCGAASRAGVPSPLHPLAGLPAARDAVGMRVALFVTCFNDTLFPSTGRAVVEVLERLGREVEFPLRQTCCGQMFVNTAYQRETLGLAARFVATFEPYDAIVTPSGSCAGSVREQHAMVARAF